LSTIATVAVCVGFAPFADADPTTTRRTLFAAARATPGKPFAAIALGMPMKDVKLDLSAIERATETRITTEHKGVVERIVVRPRASSEAETDAWCNFVEKHLRDAWGDADVRNEVWDNPATHTRVVIDDNDAGCGVSFERYVEPASWIGKSRAAVVPAWLVGQPTAKVVAAFGERARLHQDESMTQYSWFAPGLAGGHGLTTITAHISRGKVVAISANAPVANSDAVLRHLVATYGKPHGDTTEWKRPKMTLVHADKLRITIGTVP
jgi:hypothetical protein